MADSEDFAIEKLEKCSYRYLQQTAKSFGLPSNVKKMYLIQMIHAKRYCTEEILDSIVFRIKEERKQLAKARKPMKRKKKRLQGTEISSTSNQSPPLGMEVPSSSYIITYPPSSPTDRLTVLRNRHANILRPTIVKKHVESDRVLRSFNNRFRPNYSFLNLSNSVIGVIKSQNALQQVDGRQRELSVALQRHKPTDIGEHVGRSKAVVYRDFSVQQWQGDVDDVYELERQLVPVPRTSNISSKPVKRPRRISGIYPLKPSEQPHYQYTPNVGFRHEDGQISKINAVIQKPVTKTNTPKVLLSNKTTQTYIVRRNLPPHPRSLVKNVAVMSNTATRDENYKSDQLNLSNSSTDSARDSSIERDFSKQNNNRSLNKYTKSRSFDTQSLYAERESLATQNPIRYPTNKNYVEESPNRYVESRCHPIENVNRYIENRSVAIGNLNEHIKTSFETVKNIETSTLKTAVNQSRYTDNRRFAAENLKRRQNPNIYPETDEYAIENQTDHTEMGNYTIDNPNRYTETGSCISENLNKYAEMVSTVSEYLNRYEEADSSGSEYLNKYTETRSCTADNQNTENNFTETPITHIEIRNDPEEILNVSTEIVATENVNRCAENGNTKADIQKEMWDVTDYPNMSALSDIEIENQANELTPISSSNDFSVYYHKKIRAEQVRSQRLSVPREQPGCKLPRIADAFSQFNDPRYKHLTQPLYVQVSEEPETVTSQSLKDSVILEKMYNCPNQLLGISNEPLLQVATTTGTFCVNSTSIITTAIVQPPTSARDEYGTHPCERDSQRFNIEAEKVPRLYDYLRIAEQEKDFKCDEVVSATSSFASVSSQPGDNVTIPEMVDDAMELISQDGDYMERIEMDVRMQCILCEWAGSKIIMEYHFQEEHSSRIVERASREWRGVFTLGGLVARDAWSSELSRCHGRVYVLSARYTRDTLMATLTVLPKVSEEFPKYSRLTVYNKVTGEPYSWEGEITYLPDTMPYETDINGLKLDISSLNLLPNSANLKLVNGELVVNSTAKVVVGHPELDDIEIAVYVKLFD